MLLVRDIYSFLLNQPRMAVYLPRPDGLCDGVGVLVVLDGGPLPSFVRVVDEQARLHESVLLQGRQQLSRKVCTKFGVQPPPKIEGARHETFLLLFFSGKTSRRG